MALLSIIFIIGFAIGIIGKTHHVRIRKIDEMSIYLIYLLLFMMGISLGLNDAVINNIQNIGTTALIITLGGMIGSALLTAIIYSLIKKR